MKYKRTQIYLGPEDHRDLIEQARARGVSLAGLLREIVSAWTGGATPSASGFDALIGLVDEGEETDVARRQAEYKREARQRRQGRATRPGRKR